MKKIIKQKFISAVILAAGEGKRFGGLKQIYKLDNKPLLEVVIGLVSPLFDETILVLGYQAERIVSNIDLGDNIKTVINSRYREGMSVSINKALSILSYKTTHFAIFLGDMPYIKKETVLELKKYLDLQKRQIIAPIYKGKRGFPVLFSKDFVGDFLSIKGDKGARDLINKEKKYLTLVEVNDCGVIKDIDRQKDLKKL